MALRGTEARGAEVRLREGALVKVGTSAGQMCLNDSLCTMLPRVGYASDCLLVAGKRPRAGAWGGERQLVCRSISGETVCAVPRQQAHKPCKLLLL
jgi:hypothetical protein